MLVINNIGILVNISNDFIKITDVVSSSDKYSVVINRKLDKENYRVIINRMSKCEDGIYSVRVTKFIGFKESTIQYEMGVRANMFSTPYEFLNWITEVIDKLSEYVDNKKL